VSLVLFGSEKQRNAQAFRQKCAGYASIPDGAVVAPAGATLLHAVVGSNLQHVLTDPVPAVTSAAELADAVRARGAAWFGTGATGPLATLAASDPTFFEAFPQVCKYGTMWRLRDASSP